MTKDASHRTEQVGEIVAGSVALASLILADSTALHSFFGILLLVYWCRNFNKPSSISNRFIVSMAMSIAFLLLFSYPLDLILKYFGMAKSWDIILLILGIVATIFFFTAKSLYELRKSRGEK